ncbi:unnamed protein product, partial [Onchocerca flexuosa]|uniref:Secreted protein n=1 Tax=Onchocerca flexuosa TaxID=387005 RepID=A0A183I6U5_9BILA
CSTIAVHFFTGPHLCGEVKRASDITGLVLFLEFSEVLQRFVWLHVILPVLRAKSLMSQQCRQCRTGLNVYNNACEDRFVMEVVE